MRIISFESENFRNLERQRICFDKNLNILYGNNAQGKTNTLEAICLCALGKSPRTDKDREMIKTGESYAHVAIEFESRFGDGSIEFTLSGGKRRIAVNSVPIMKTGDLMGYFNAVWFSPDELKLVKEGPQERRRFMDIDVCQTDRTYLDTLSRFNKALSQRNNLLKENFNANTEDMLCVWDAVLAKEGAKLILKRKSFIKRLSPVAKEIHFRISDGKEDLETVYFTQVKGETADELAESYLELLKNSREKDKNQRFTTVGAQRDDVKLLLSGSDVRVFGSQGQVRTTALSLKLAETRIMAQLTGDTPVLLLDDVLSELDDERQKHLVEFDKDMQIILTTAESGSLGRLGGRLITVNCGGYDCCERNK